VSPANPVRTELDAASRNGLPRVALAALCAAYCLCAVAGCQRHEKPKDTATAAVSASAAPAPQTLEPCRLLTTDEASIFLDGSAVAAPSNAVSYASSCIWEAREPLRGLQVMTSTPAQLHADEALRKVGADTVEKRFAQLVQTLTLGGKATPVSGLGDDALWIEDSQQLWIMKRGRALITVSFHAEQRTADVFEKSRAISEKLLARL